MHAPSRTSLRSTIEGVPPPLRSASRVRHSVSHRVGVRSGCLVLDRELRGGRQEALLELCPRAYLELARALARDAEASADLGEAQLVGPIGQDAHLDDVALTRVELLDCVL